MNDLCHVWASVALPVGTLIYNYSCVSWRIPAASLAGEKRITSWQVRCGECG